MHMNEVAGGHSGLHVREPKMFCGTCAIDQKLLRGPCVIFDPCVCLAREYCLKSNNVNV
jgi:hypothetical protein